MLYLSSDQWLLIGLVLIVIELFLPGVFLLWIGLAALGVAAASYIWVLSPMEQVILFGILAPSLSFLGKIVQKRAEAQPDTLYLNKKTNALIGQEFILTHPIVQGKGMIKLEDTLWQVQGNDLPVGALVKVVGLRGTALVVKETSNL